jgi:CBS domain-containing protein
MEREYQALPLRDLGANAGIRRPTQAKPSRVTLESPALEVMTDLTRISPATIRAQAPLSGANQFMITRGVRLLLVTDEEHEAVLGLITATDILGERPTTVAASRGTSRDELTVADIMTPAAQVQVVAFGYAQGACVGHVLASMRKTGRQHALVVDYDELPPRPPAPAAKRAMVRGIFSAAQIAAQLGGTVSPIEAAPGE